MGESFISFQGFKTKELWSMGKKDQRSLTRESTVES